MVKDGATQILYAGAMNRTILLAATALSLVACSSNAPETADNDIAPITASAADSNAIETASVTATPPAFAQCAMCHTATKGGANGIGPNLWGVAGKPSGRNATFAYSGAFKDAKPTWDDATLARWITNPQQMVPGSKMIFVGMTDPAKRAEVVKFLKTLNDEAKDDARDD
ncbi:MAG: c-type cytochrome [Pseudomonadota bacterium]